MNAGGKRVLILVGSPKPLERSASARIGGIVADRLKRRGWGAETYRAVDMLGVDGSMQSALRVVDRADVVLLTTPLYVDSLPAPVIHVLQRIADRRSKKDPQTRPRLASIINCGFAEAGQNRTAQRVVECFATQAQLAWAGGVSLGSAGFLTRKGRESLNHIAEALAAGVGLPEQNVIRLGRNVIPSWLYRVVGNRMWKRQAKKNDVLRQLGARPYS